MGIVVNSFRSAIMGEERLWVPDEAPSHLPLVRRLFGFARSSHSDGPTPTYCPSVRGADARIGVIEFATSTRVVHGDSVTGTKPRAEVKTVS